jgi:hypothetical protein
MASVSADIQKFQKNSQGSIEYFIKVVFNGREWSIRKRYSDFLTLDKFLRKDGWDVQIELPPKTWWKKYDKRLLAQRCKDLQNYLNSILTTTVSSESSLIREFFEFEVKKLEYARRQSFHEFRIAEKLDAVVGHFGRVVIAIPVSAVNLKPFMVNKTRSRAPSFAPLAKKGSFVGKSSFSDLTRRNSLNNGEPAGSVPNKASFSRSLSFMRKDSHNIGDCPASPSISVRALSRDHRPLIDLSSMSGSYAESSAIVLAELSKKENYLGGVQALWPAYVDEIEVELLALENDELCMPLSCLARASYSGCINANAVMHNLMAPVKKTADEGAAMTDLIGMNVIASLYEYSGGQSKLWPSLVVDKFGSQKSVSSVDEVQLSQSPPHTAGTSPLVVAASPEAAAMAMVAGIAAQKAIASLTRRAEDFSKSVGTPPRPRRKESSSPKLEKPPQTATRLFDAAGVAALKAENEATVARPKLLRGESVLRG